jgi:GTP-binding protein
MLRRVFVLVDSRTGITPYDHEFLQFLSQNFVSHQIVLTKCDKVSHQHIEEVMRDIYKRMTHSSYNTCFPYVIPTSSEDHEGILELQGATYSASNLIEQQWTITGTRREKLIEREEKQKVSVLEKAAKI